jgi:mannose-1-phosphate guanylyltransferase
VTSTPALPRAAVIMAGGVGERFWPLSRRQRPKQLLPLHDSHTLLEKAHRRLEPLVPAGQIYVLTTAALAAAVSEQAPYVSPANIVVEPMRKNTAACLALAAAVLEQRHGPTVMAVTTADHLIEDDRLFQATLERGFQLASSHSQMIVFGLRPTRPETGYGYIEIGEISDAHEDLPCHAVRAFHEKPDLATAQRYVAGGRHLWNSGMFVWQTGVLRRAFAEHAKVYAQAMDAMSQIDLLGGDDMEALAAIFEDLPNLSIDCAVLEHARNVWALPASFPWLDLGGFESLRHLMPHDTADNARQGCTVAVDTRGSTLYSTGPLVATCGVEDLVVIATPDAVLVCPRGRAADVKSVIAALSAENQESHL